MKQEIIQIDLGGVNCYLGRQDENFILFDTGGHLIVDKKFTNRRELLEEGLKKAGCSAENLKLIVLTHGDNDHTTNAKYIREKYDAPIAMHAGDAEGVNHPSLEKEMESFNYRSLVFRIVFKLLKKKLEEITQKVLAEFESFKPDILLKEGDSFLEYGFDAKVMYLPGHTLGSIAVLTAERDLIVGDTLVNGKKPTPALNAADFTKLEESIERLRSLKIKTVYPGHGKPFLMQQFC